jgi:soluble lytic murein transglycosylase-like protein
MKRALRLFGWLAVLGGIGSMTASAVAEDVAGTLRPSYVENFATVSDPISFASRLTYELPRPIVPLTREDAVANELWMRNRTLSETEVQAVAHALVEEGQSLSHDPLLFLAVIHIESYYNHLAVSYAGAEGLMQLMPPTAAWMAEQSGERMTDRHSFDPVFNVRMGSRYLAHLADEFGGRMDLALTAYNRGPHNTWAIMRRTGNRKLPRDILDFYATKVLDRYRVLVDQYGKLPLN